MNCVLPDLLRFLAASGGGDMSALERHRARVRWQREQKPITCIANQNEQVGFLTELLAGRDMKPGPGVDDGWILSFENGSEFEMSLAVPAAATIGECATELAEVTGNGEPPPEIPCSAVGTESTFIKRKADASDNFKPQEKKIKQSAEKQSTAKKTSGKSTGKKQHSVITTDLPKSDYIHVRARRGQATDSHSLAERVRREKISERMKYLQELVPGCNKIIGKAGLLDEIINYVQSLQQQVEFLSMKLAVIDPRMDLDLDCSRLAKMPPACATEIDASTKTINPFEIQFNSVLSSQEIPFHGFDTQLRRTISAPAEALLDSSWLNGRIESWNWDDELQSFYGRCTPSNTHLQPLTGARNTSVSSIDSLCFDKSTKVRENMNEC